MHRGWNTQRVSFKLRLARPVACGSAHLGDHDLMALRAEAEKYLMVGALNVVECVAFVGAIKPTR